MFGYVLTVVILIATAPLIALSVLAVKLTSRGPIVYSQVRLGRYGRPFTIYKIRSMHDNCEGASGPQWSTAGDPRVTPVGRILRVTHLDELPQLWNVLRGDMTLVGPRPERPEFAAKLELAIPHYADRTQVLPGLTGLAQIQLPPDTDLESVRRKLVCDLEYMDLRNPWLDVRVLVATATGVVGIPFYWVGFLLRIPSVDEIEQGAAAGFSHPPALERGASLGVARSDEVSNSVVVPTAQSQLA